MPLTIRGYSDDAIVVEGDFVEQFDVYTMSDEDARPAYLACSDGTLLSVHYDDFGVWRFSLVKRGRCKIRHTPGDEDSGTDRVQLAGEQVVWVLLGSELAK